jgi:hypothetical protein
MDSADCQTMQLTFEQDDAFHQKDSPEAGGGNPRGQHIDEPRRRSISGALRHEQEIVAELGEEGKTETVVWAWDSRTSTPLPSSCISFNASGAALSNDGGRVSTWRRNSASPAQLVSGWVHFDLLSDKPTHHAGQTRPRSSPLFARGHTHPRPGDTSSPPCRILPSSPAYPR